MRKPIQEAAYDIEFIRKHTLQPAWYKVLKVFLLAFFLLAYLLLFGWVKTAVFLFAFLVLSLVVHLIYRSKTDRFTQGWLDFEVQEVNGIRKPVRIGKYYYLAVLTNAVLAVLTSQILV